MTEISKFFNVNLTDDNKTHLNVNVDEISIKSTDSIRIQNDLGSLSFDTGITFTDLRGVNSVGLEYAEDYSTNYTDRSLIDKGHLTNQINQAISGVSSTFSNSINTISNYVDTSISGISSTFSNSIENLNTQINTNRIDLINYVDNAIMYLSGQTTTSAITYYVNLSGSDELGDGSIELPWYSLEHALRAIPKNIKDFTTIQLGSGDYYMTTACLNIISEFMLLKPLSIKGQLDLVVSGFTAKVIDPSGNPYKRLVSGATWDYNNQYTGYCARHDNYAPAYKWSPIGVHETNNISSTLTPDGYWVGAIYNYSTNLIYVDGKSPKSIEGSANFKNCDLQITLPDNTHSKLFNSNESTYLFENVKINAAHNYKINLQGNVTLNHSFIHTTSDTMELLRITETETVKLVSLFLYNTNSGNTSPAIVINDSSIILQRLYIHGYAYGIEYQGNSELSLKYGHYPNVFENIGCVFRLTNSGAKMIFGEWYGTHKLYIYNVNYMYSMNGATDNIHIYFPADRLAGDIAPLQEWFVPATGGTWAGIANNLKALRNKPISYIDPTRNVIIYYPTLYPEISTGCTLTLTNSSSGLTDVGNITQNSAIFIEYVIKRSGLTEQGTIRLNDKLNNDLINDSDFDDTGVSFSKLIVGNIIYLVWTTTPSDSNAIIKYTARRIMI
jgi:hypothetical protein